MSEKEISEKELKSVVDTLEILSRNKELHRVDRALARRHINNILDMIKKGYPITSLKGAKDFIAKFKPS